MQKYKAFTLVELIVVITILAILGTIAFISFQGYSKEARDTKRQTDTRSLISKINILQAEGIQLSDLISPYSTGSNIKENTLKINDQTKIGYQGKINFENLGENESNFVDPKSGHDYPFAYSKDTIENDGKEEAYNFMQLAYVSEKDGRTKLVGNYYQYNSTADSPSLFTKEGTTGTNGNSDFITDNDNNQVYDIGVAVAPENSGNNNETPVPAPINGECGEANGKIFIETPIDDLCKEGEIDNFSGDGPWSWVCKKGNDSGTDTNCKTILGDTAVLECTAKGQILEANSTYSDIYGTCDTKDIVVCSEEGRGYVISACNVGATKASEYDLCVDIPSCTLDRVGYYFQWGNNFASKYGDGQILVQEDAGSALPSTYSSTGFIQGFVNWSSVENRDLWGGVTRTKEAMKGPCGDGYHVPTNDELEAILLSGGWKTWLSEGIPEGDIFIHDLKLPMNSRRHINGGYGRIGVYSYIWASDTNENGNPYQIHSGLTTNFIRNSYTYPTPDNGANPAGGANSVRCVRN